MYLQCNYINTGKNVFRTKVLSNTFDNVCMCYVVMCMHGWGCVIIHNRFLFLHKQSHLVAEFHSINKLDETNATTKVSGIIILDATHTHTESNIITLIIVILICILTRTHNIHTTHSHIRACT